MPDRTWAKLRAAMSWSPDDITIGPLAMKLGVLESKLRRLANRRLIPLRRVGTLRVFAESDIPANPEACIRAGYLKPELEAAGV